jgi:hypothetical protein
MQFRKEANKVLEAAPKAVNRPSHNQIEPALCGVSAERVEGRAPIPTTLCTTDAVILVDLDELTADAGSDRT